MASKSTRKQPLQPGRAPEVVEVTHPPAPAAMPTNPPAYVRIALMLLLLVALGLYMAHIRVGFGNTIVEQHAFRQTQTGLTALYFQKEGIRLDYITPMYGFPWKIPMEFPLYQMVTALYANASGSSLDVAGRTVSVAFFLLSLLPLFLIIRRLTQSSEAPLVVITFVLVNPLVIYWSRTFMIESTAVFFNLLYMWVGLEMLYKPKVWMYGAGLALGLITPIAKSTTGFVYITVLALFYVVSFLNDFKASNLQKTVVAYLPKLVVFFVVPLVITLLWTKYTDGVKLANFTSAFWASSDPKMQEWNYGTLTQKFSLATWQQINGFQFGALVLAIIVSGVAIFVKTSYKIPLLIFAFGGVIGPMIFTNLYFVHDYYSYASIFLLCAAFGLFLAYFIVQVNNIAVRGAAVLLLALWVSYQYKDYNKSGYARLQKTNNEYFKVVGENLTRHLKEDEGFIFYGYIGDPFVPYYAGRKGVCMSPYYVEQAKINPGAFFKRIDKSNIRAMVVCDGNNQSIDLLNKTIQHFKLSPTPVNTDSQTMGYFIFTALK